MASFEKVDSGGFSGGFSGGRSNFSQTCSLLSQYLKVKGSFGELSLGLTPRVSESKGTMDFLPTIEKSGQNSGPVDMNMLPQFIEEEALYKSNSCKRSEKETGQMTIFYAGQVIVLDNFPADKAKDIMMLASKYSAALAPPLTAEKPAETAGGSQNIVSAFGRACHVPQPALASDLPIARKNSLARFLEKRKDRITANDPYQARRPGPAPIKPIKTEPWLGLAPQLPLQTQRH